MSQYKDLAVPSGGSQLAPLWGLHFLTQITPASFPVDQYLHILKIIVITFAVSLETEPRTLPMLGKCSAMNYSPNPYFSSSRYIAQAGLELTV